MTHFDKFPEKPLYSFVVASSRTSYSWSQTSASTDTSTSESDNSDELPINEENDFSVMCHLGTERFKIDRRKLEKMIKTASNIEGANSAEFYFEQIMKATDTFITWPRNLKIGARTRKDPFLRIDGKPNDIAWAKGLILAKLATRGPLLKMKIIISNTDHPHIIGRGGSNINRIMEKTDTHIHFPDSNRSTSLEKRHQVTLYGSLTGLEQARVSLRASVPILMSFELPIGTCLPRHDVPYIKQLEMDFNVKVIFMSVPKHTSYFAIVKGTDSEVERLKQAVRLLINLTCGARSAQTLLNIKLEISKQVFDMSIAEESINLSDLKERTRTVIAIPDAFESSREIPVIITGPIDGVYEAMKELMACMPIELTFDIVDNPAYTSEIMSLAMKYGISITIKQKRDNSASITMKTAEKCITHIYAANEEVLDMQNTFTDEMEIPKAYFLIEPAFRRALENNSNSKQYEDVSTRIWAPIDPSSENNFLQGMSSSGFISSSLRNNSEMEVEQRQEQSDSMASFSSDSTQSEDTYQCGGRRSSDWAVIKTENNYTQFSEYGFNSDDLEVAFILTSSSPNNFSTMLSNTPGAEREYRE